MSRAAEGIRVILLAAYILFVLLFTSFGSDDR